jgi:hypothetical protein
MKRGRLKITFETASFLWPSPAAPALLYGGAASRFLRGHDSNAFINSFNHINLSTYHHFNFLVNLSTC